MRLGMQHLKSSHSSGVYYYTVTLDVTAVLTDARKFHHIVCLCSEALVVYLYIEVFWVYENKPISLR